MFVGYIESGMTITCVSKRIRSKMFCVESCGGCCFRTTPRCCVQRVFCSAASPMPFRATRRPQLNGGVHYHASFLFAGCLENGCLFLFMHCCVDVRSSWRTCVDVRSSHIICRLFASNLAFSSTWLVCPCILSPRIFWCC